MDNALPDRPPPIDKTGPSQQSHDQTIRDTLPTTFKVGDKELKAPFVTISEIQGHLALLRALAELKQVVIEYKDDGSPIPHMPGGAERRWTWFVNLASERYALELLLLGL